MFPMKNGTTLAAYVHLRPVAKTTFHLYLHQSPQRLDAIEAGCYDSAMGCSPSEGLGGQNPGTLMFPSK